MAILLGAFLMHGLTPGPDMLARNSAALHATIVWSLTLAHVIGALICLSASKWLARISTVRPEILLPIVLSLSISSPPSKALTIGATCSR